MTEKSQGLIHVFALQRTSKVQFYDALILKIQFKQNLEESCGISLFHFLEHYAYLTILSRVGLHILVLKPFHDITDTKCKLSGASFVSLILKSKIKIRLFGRLFDCGLAAGMPIIRLFSDKDSQ